MIPSASFTSSFPLPYRVLFLAGIGILCWATNLHFLYLLGIDTAYILDIRNDPRSSSLSASSSASRLPSGPPGIHAFVHPATLYPPVYRLFAIYAAWVLGGWLLFGLLSHGDATLMDRYKTIPAFTALVIIGTLFCPFNILHKRERMVFLQSVRRCLVSPLNQPIHFADVILADVFTSFAKVIGDIWIAARMLSPSGSLAVWPLDEGFYQWMVPVMMSLPYIARFRQCIVEYISSNRQSTRSLLNAIKYATAFPVIFLSAAQRQVVTDLLAEKGPEMLKGKVWHGEHHLFRMWFLSVCVNSLYSFWWDVTNDWGFDLLLSSTWSRSPLSQDGTTRALAMPQLPGTKRSRPPSPLPLSRPPTPPNGDLHRPKHPFGLRSTLLLHRDPPIYYAAILLNFILRFTWSLKLSPHLYAVAELESGVFLMEALELLRRWLWVFFRVEWEAVKKQGGLAIEDSRGIRADGAEEIEFRFRGNTSESEDL